MPCVHFPKASLICCCLSQSPEVGRGACPLGLVFFPFTPSEEATVALFPPSSVLSFRESGKVPISASSTFSEAWHVTVPSHCWNVYVPSSVPSTVPMITFTGPECAAHQWSLSCIDLSGFSSASTSHLGTVICDGFKHKSPC